jgi:prepilin-type N-terminal cleavage/methylation domain-containing protein
MATKRINKGFTLVELTLVMAFMSILLLSILYMTIHAGKLYTKGLTNKSLNQVSREVFDVMKRDIAAADSSQVTAMDELGSGILKSGRFCTGSISYIWNTAPLLNDASTQKVKSNGSPITFRRVIDPSGSLCQENGGAGVYPMDITALQSTELLSSDGRSFAIYTMDVKALASDNAKNGLYSVKMVLGTNEPNTTQSDVVQGFQCVPPTAQTANFDYCTVAEFYTILRTGGNK